MNLLETYQQGFGQRINPSKSLLILPSSFCMSAVQVMEEIIDIKHKELSLPYMGCILYKGRRQICQYKYQYLTEKIHNRLADLKHKLLSLGGRLILIKHVLSSIPIHALFLMDPPKGVLYSMGRIVEDFFWGVSDHGKKRHWASWASLCAPTDENKLGLRSLQDIVEAFTLKL
ncbi:hypothetical protein ACH5RR_033903 [Cinchona calisaya]|uniref:Reverse transcriptase n=1 Tax=Cinchona calisaya TaxID=153742 RepID=A0ABD2YDY3_9GENT